jgi:N-acetylneuraminic acid mutarotase
MMKKIIVALSICLWVMGGSAWAQDMWTWMSGSKIGSQRGVYGKKGLPDAANVPGARGQSISWTDSSGNLWLFGGCKVSNDHRLTQRNDLWCYNSDTDMWTWMSGPDTYNQRGSYGTKGTPHIDNVPGARGQSISWIDSSGNLWLFGGYGQSSDDRSDRMNDRWRYEAPE